jgi:S1-C subfamily serine protease
MSEEVERTEDQPVPVDEVATPADDVTPPAEDVTAPITRPVWDPATGTWRTEGDVHAEPPAFMPSPASPPSRGLAPGAAVAIAAVAAVLASALTLGATRLWPSRTSGVAVERHVSPATAAATRSDGSIVSIAAKARPWVVNIDVSGRQRGFFGTQVVQGTGSGVILRSDGYIITNNHVVENAQQVRVTLASGQSVSGRVTGADPVTDVGVVKIDKTGLPSADIGTAKDLEVGELAVAIGSPLGLRQTVTAGIISALGRTVDRGDEPPLVDMIQTDAAVTQGNSGGALLDARGALVGVNSAIAASPEVGAEGIAFAIPIDIAKAVADELIASGKATHPWMGVSLGTIDPETSSRFGVSEGALVAEIVPDGPAAKGGLREQDVIVGFDGKKIASSDELVVAIRQHKVGDKVKVDVVRGGDKQSLEVTLGDRPLQ